MIFPVAKAEGVHYRDDWGEPRSGGRTHKGNDIFGPKGTPLLAVEDGTILKAYVDPLGGNAVTLQGRSGTRYYYAHLDTFGVRSGSVVTAGDTVGTLGRTGNAQGTPYHLHFEIHPGGGEAVDPYPYLRAAEVRGARPSWLPLLVVAVPLALWLAWEHVR